MPLCPPNDPSPPAFIMPIPLHACRVGLMGPNDLNALISLHPMCAGSDGPVHDSWILPKDDSIRYSDLDWSPSYSQSSERYCITSKDKRYSTCLLHGPCFLGGHLLFECKRRGRGGGGGGGSGSGSNGGGAGSECTQGGKMPRVVAFSRDGYTTFGLGPFGVEPVLLKPSSVALPLPPGETAMPSHLQNVSRDGVPPVPLPPSLLTSPDMVFVILHPYNPGNLGHILGDDIFPIFLSLSTFGLEHAADIVVVASTPFSGRQLDLLAATGLRTITYEEAEGLCFPRVVVGLSQFTFVRPVVHGHGHMLDHFSAWLLARFSAARDGGADRPAGTASRPSGLPKAHGDGGSRKHPSFTVVQKDFLRASAPMGMSNGAEVGLWLREAFPQSAVRVLSFPEVHLTCCLVIINPKPGVSLAPLL